MTHHAPFKLETTLAATLSALWAMPAYAAIEGSLDPQSVVAQWSDSSTYAKIIDINFSDASWPDTWQGETGRDCPDYTAEGYVNAVLTVPANGGGDVAYPVLFHHCTFANKQSYGGMAGATAAFCRQYYLGEKCSGNSKATYNNWTVAGHTAYLEDSIAYDAQGKPTYGQAGFVQMCRDAATADEKAQGVSRHGWMEIDHLPYVERVQWSWSSTSWGRGIKCDYKVGQGEWQPLVWLGSNKQKAGYTVFSDQGYFMENVIGAADVSLRWRVWDGDEAAPYTAAINPYGQQQAPRVHKVRIFGEAITAEQAQYAAEHPEGDVGELSDLSGGGKGEGGDEADTTRMLAFPTAEGFGKYATGGRGGRVVKVTSTADDGSAGTLRWAFGQHKGEPLTIVFEVSGDIRLESELKVKRSDWTLAGQTAPGEGIVISHNKVNFGGSQNFIVRNVRFRSGHADTAGAVLQDQAVGAENCANYIFDHCVFGWSVEENMNTQDCHFVTVQRSIVHEGLYNSGHKKGARGYGTQWGGSPATYCRNLLAHNKSRSPRINGARGEDYVVFLEYINNVNYNFGGTGGCYGGENTADIASYNGLNSAHECNFMGNYYKPGPASKKSGVKFVNASYARDGATSWAPSKWYVSGNKIEGDASATADNWKAMSAETYSLAQIRADERIVPEHAYYKYSLAGNVGAYTPGDYMIDSVLTADEAYADVLAHAGTVNRDAIERRIVEEVKDGNALYGGAATGASTGIIDTEADCEGFVAYTTAYTVPTDTDGDGMPDAWEAQHGLDPATADQNLVNAEGYTALEVYLNSLMGEQQPDGFAAALPALKMATPTLRYDRATDTLHAGDAALGALLTAYATDGRVLARRRITSEATSLSFVRAKAFILKVEGAGIAPRVVKINK